MLDLDAIEARANAATPGPWVAYIDAHEVAVRGDRSRTIARCIARGPGDATHESFHGSVENANRDLIAAARTDIPALVARVRELEAQLQGLDYRAHPDHYKHNLQRAEEAASEYLAALEASRAENERLRTELEQAENAAFCECGRVNL